MTRTTLYGTLTQDEKLNENEKAMLYIKECAELAGLEVIEDKTAFSINFIAEIMKRLRKEPKTGHWTHDGSYWKYRFICSECNYRLLDKPTNYCPNCGCKMERKDK